MKIILLIKQTKFNKQDIKQVMYLLEILKKQKKWDIKKVYFLKVGGKNN